MSDAIRVQRLVPAETVTDGSGQAIGERPVPAEGDCKGAASEQTADPSPNVADWKRRWAASQSAMHAAKTPESRKRHERELEAIVAEFNAAKSATGGNVRLTDGGEAQ